jgi:uncharacterized protein DUF4156
LRVDLTLRIALLSTTALLAGACSWVELTPAGQNVHVGTMAEAMHCEKLGATHAKTSTKVGLFSRSAKKVDEEIEFLARNEAAEMGGNTIVAQGPTSSEGRRSYDVFRCHGS